jgi:hypothetical protein
LDGFSCQTGAGLCGTPCRRTRYSRWRRTVAHVWSLLSKASRPTWPPPHLNASSARGGWCGWSSQAAGRARHRATRRHVPSLSGCVALAPRESAHRDGNDESQFAKSKHLSGLLRFRGQKSPPLRETAGLRFAAHDVGKAFTVCRGTSLNIDPQDLFPMMALWQSAVASYQFIVRAECWNGIGKSSLLSAGRF